MTGIENRRNRILLVSLLLVFIMAFTPGDGQIAGAYLDKVAHFTAFFFLSLNCCYKYQSDKSKMAILLGVVVLGFVTEIVQQYIPGRNMDIYDALADTLGTVAAYFSYEYKKNRIDLLLQKIGA